jgi:hypothetical protein
MLLAPLSVNQRVSVTLLGLISHRPGFPGIVYSEMVVAYVGVRSTPVSNIAETRPRTLLTIRFREAFSKRL